MGKIEIVCPDGIQGVSGWLWDNYIKERRRGVTTTILNRALIQVGDFVVTKKSSYNLYVERRFGRTMIFSNTYLTDNDLSIEFGKGGIVNDEA